nr:myomesin-3-like [Crassostrea gigas]
MLLSRPSTRARWSKVAKMDDNTTKYSPKDLIDYLFRVSAVNEEGQVSPLETKEPVRLKRKMFYLQVKVEVSKLGPDFVTLDWKSLSSVGGSKVTGYVVKQKRGSDGDWEEVATLMAIETSYKVPKLAEDQEYFFSITALNQNGQGETCELDTSVVPKRPPEKTIATSWSSHTLRHSENLFGVSLETQQE